MWVGVVIRPDIKTDILVGGIFLKLKKVYIGGVWFLSLSLNILSFFETMTKKKEQKKISSTIDMAGTVTNFSRGQKLLMFSRLSQIANQVQQKFLPF